MKVKLEDVCKKDTSNIMQKDLKDSNGIYPIYGASGFIKNIDFYQQENPYIAIVKDGAGIGRVMKLPAKSSVISTMQYIIPNDNIDIGYLSYAMEHMNLSKYFTGATIPHIYFKDYKKEVIFTPKLEEQIQIAKILDKVNELITKRHKQLEKLDELVKARFVEMFGDPVNNDKNWEVFLLSEVTDKIGSGATPRGGKQSYQDKGVTLVRSMNVYDGFFLYKDLAHITDLQASELSNVIVQSDDVFINITGASVARSCIVPDDVLPARVNQHVAIIRCKKEYLEPVFLNQQLLSLSYKRLLLSLGELGGATRQALTKQQLNQLFVIVPPIELQKKYVYFVKHIERTKENINDSLVKLKILKNAIMQEYFG